MRKWLQRLLLAIALLAGLYLLAANAFLNTPVGSWALNRRPERLRIDWTAAWSLLPGRVDVRGLEIHGSNARMAWSLEVDRGGGWIDLPGLLGRRFRVRGFAGDGVRSSLVRKAVGLTPGKKAAAPRKRRGWTVRIEDVSLTGVREIGLGRFRLAGDGRVRGGVSLEIGGSFHLDNSSLEMAQGRLLLADQALARDLEVQLEARIAPYAPRQHPGVAGLDFINGTLRVRGLILEVPILSRAAGPPKGPGQVAVDLRVDQGRLAAGSRIDIRSPRPLRVMLRVPREDQLLLEAETAGLAMGRRQDRPPFLRSDSLHLKAATSELRLSRLLATARALAPHPRPLSHPHSQPAGEGSLHPGSSGAAPFPPSPGGLGVRVGEGGQGGEGPATLFADFRAENLRLTSASRTVSWEVAADRASGRIDLPALLRRQAVVEGLRGEGVSGRVERKRRVVPEAGQAPRRPWAVRIAGAHLTAVREVAVNGYRLAGDVAVEGGFNLDEQGMLTLDPTTLRTSAGHLEGPRGPIASALDVDAAARLGPYLPREHPGMAGLAFLSGSLQAQGRQDRGGGGDLDADLTLDRGRLLPGSRLALHTPVPAISSRPLLVLGAVEAAGGRPQLRLTAEARDVAIGGGRGRPPLLQSATARIDTTTAELRLDRLLVQARELRGAPQPALSLPGDLQVSQLRLSSATAEAVWQVTVEQGRGRIDLAALRRRQIVLDQVTGDGVSVWIDPARPAAARSAGTRNPWSLALREARLTGIRSIAAAGDRLLGPGSIEGSLAFDPRSGLEVRRILFAVPAGRVESGGATVARRLSVRAEGRLDPLVPGQLHGAELLRLVSGSAAVQGRVSSLGLLQRWFQKFPWLRIDGEGRLDVDLRLDKGRLLPGTRLAVGNARVAAAFLDSLAIGEGTVTGSVDPRTGAAFRVAFDRFEISPRVDDPSVPAPPSYIRGSGLRLDVRSKDLDLATPVTDLRAVIELPAAEVPDITVYNAYFPPGTGVAILSGTGRLRLRLDLDGAAQSGQGEIVLSSDAIQARFQDLELAGRLMLRTKLASPDLRAGRFQLGGTRLDLDEVTYRETDAAPGEHSPGWWAHLELTDGSMVWSRPLSLRSSARLEMKDSGFLLTLFARKKSFLRWFDRVLSIEGIVARGDLRFGDGLIEINPLQVTGGRLDLRSRLRFTKDAKQGDLFLRYGRFAVGIELRNGQRDFKLRRPEQWYESRKGFD